MRLCRWRSSWSSLLGTAPRSAANGSFHSKANKTTGQRCAWEAGWIINLVNSVQQAVQGTSARLTFLTVVKLVQLTGFRLALAKDQVVSDVPVGLIGRFPLQDDLGGRVGGRNGVQRNRRFWRDIAEIVKQMCLSCLQKTHIHFQLHRVSRFCSCSVKASPLTINQL